jgi:predicted acylesterase/phospholipase RssA
MRSYKHPEAAESLFHECKVWEACRATSAATTFFDPIAIGKKGQRFIDGGILYNNPVRLVHQEAEQLWPDRDCLLISVGTGEPPGMAFKGNIVNIIKGLKNIATETEQTADQFYQSHKAMVDDNRYYRFNVTHGLASIGLEEWSQVSAIADTTETYLDHGETRKKFRECVDRLLEIESEGMEYLPNPPSTRQPLLLEATPTPMKQPLLLEASPAYSYDASIIGQRQFQPEEDTLVFSR